MQQENKEEKRKRRQKTLYARGMRPFDQGEDAFS